MVELLGHQLLYPIRTMMLTGSEKKKEHWSAVNNTYVNGLIKFQDGSYISSSGLIKNPGVALMNVGVTAKTILQHGRALYVGTNKGVFRSNDSGANWIPINTGLTNTVVQALSIHDGDLYVGTGEGVIGGGIFKMGLHTPIFAHEDECGIWVLPRLVHSYKIATLYKKWRMYE